LQIKLFSRPDQILAALDRQTADGGTRDKLSRTKFTISVFARGRIPVLRKFSNLAVLCIALATATGMLAWVSAMAINVLLDSPGDGAAAMKSVEPVNASGSK